MKQREEVRHLGGRGHLQRLLPIAALLQYSLVSVRVCIGARCYNLCVLQRGVRVLLHVDVCHVIVLVYLGGEGGQYAQSVTICN